MTQPLRLAMSSADQTQRELVLVARVRDGDAVAFRALFDAYYLPLCSYVFGYVGSRALAEEVVQDIFGAVWEQRAEWRVTTSVRTYLFGAARNRALNTSRQQRLDDRWRKRAPSTAEVPGLSAGPGAADRDLHRDDLAAALERAMQRLPERQRQAFYLRWRGHLSHQEIAQLMGITVKTVENTLAAAFRALRPELVGFL